MLNAFGTFFFYLFIYFILFACLFVVLVVVTCHASTNEIEMALDISLSLCHFVMDPH